MAGAILASGQARGADGVAICARVSSCDQRGDLGRQVADLAEDLAAGGTAPAEVVSEAGSGRNGHRTRLLSLLRDASAGTVVVGHRGRLARFGAGCLEAALAAQGRELVVAGQAGVSDDLVRDVAGVLAGFCARVCGQQQAMRRAGLARSAGSTDRVA